MGERDTPNLSDIVRTHNVLREELKKLKSKVNHTKRFVRKTRDNNPGGKKHTQKPSL